MAARTTGPRCARSWALLSLSAALSAGAALGCTDSTMSGSGGGGGYEPGGALSFEHQGTLELGPLEERSIVVLGQPGATVRLYLLGGSLDASINRTSATVDGTGRATFVLRAPGQPATFRLRASASESTAELPVAVSDSGFAELRISPIYAGVRELEGWTASVLVGASCADVLAGFPADPEGALRATAPREVDPVIGSVPVGAKLAVAIRAGALASGCVESTLSAPGSARIELEVSDRPVVFEGAAMSLSLGFSPDAYAFGALVEAETNDFATAAFPERSALPSQLLGAMRAELPEAERSAFDAHRADEQLDPELDTLIGASDARSFVAELESDVCSIALANASLGLSASLVGLESGARVEIQSLGSVPAARAGFADAALAGWQVDPGDLLLLGASLSWAPRALIREHLDTAASSRFGAPLGASLAAHLDCSAIGALVGGFGSCESSCAEQLCESAISSMVDAAMSSVEPGQLGQLELVMSGLLRVDALAAPWSFEGSWVGTLSRGALASGVEGSAAGSATAPE